MLPRTEPALSRAQFEAVSPGRTLGLYSRPLGERGINSRRKLLRLVKFLRVGSLVRELGAELTENAEGRDWVIFLLGLPGSP